MHLVGYLYYCIRVLSHPLDTEVHNLCNKMCEVFMAVKIQTVVLVLWLCCVADNNHPLIHSLTQHQWLQGLPNAAQLSQSTWLQESPTDPHAVTIQMTTGIIYWFINYHNLDEYRYNLLTHILSQSRWLQESPTDPHAIIIQLTAFSSSSSSSKVLQSNANLCHLNRLLPVSSVFWLLFPFCNLSLINIGLNTIPPSVFWPSS